MKHRIPGSLLLCVGLAACADTVGPAIRDRFDYSTPAGFSAAVDSTYGALPRLWGREEMALLAQPGTDTWTFAATAIEMSPMEEFGRYTLAPYTWGLMQVWSGLYDIVGRANAVLDHAGTVRGLDPAARKALLGEARFLRALAYFQLVQTWGDVTLNLSERDALTRTPTRAPAGEVYAAIIADLDTAVAYLPVRAAWGRAARGAAQHLLAKAYLTRAYRSYGEGAADFRRALALADSVITSGQYSLVPDYADLWCARHRTGTPPDPNRQGFCDLHGWSEQNAEVIFPIVFPPAPAAQQGNMLHVAYLSFYRAAGLVRDLDNGWPYARFRPLVHTIALFEQVRWLGAPGASDIRDTRFDAAFQTLWFADSAASAGNATGPCPSCTSGAPIAVGDTALWMPGYAVSDAFRQARRYLVLVPCQSDVPPACWGNASDSMATYGDRRFPSLKKYQDNLRPSVDALDGGKDIYLMRLGETYLLAAEAAVGLGDRAGAAAYVNVLRRRAASPAHKADNDVAPAAMDLDFIMDERERELAGEVNRWHDLVRPGPEFFVQRVKAHNPLAAYNIDQHFALRPIPLQQIDSAGAAYQQNPGY